MTTRTTWLRPPNLLTLSAALNRLLVSAYKLVGFVILGVILLGIVAFVGLHGSYVVHRAWLVPTVISPTDPAVLDLRARIAEESWMRRKLASERTTIEAKLNRTRLVGALEKSFQAGFQSALAGDASASRGSIALLESLEEERRQVARDLRNITRTLETTSAEQLERDYQARLIDQRGLLSGTYQVAQLARARLDLEERQVELAERIRRTRREIDALEAARSDESDVRNRLTYEGLVLRREHARSLAEGIGADAEAIALERSLEELDLAIAHYDELLVTLGSATLLQATEQELHLAFVAYENRASVQAGAELYGCRLGLLGCRRVGQVKRYLDGEHREKHPVYGKELRGQLVELELDEPEWAKASVLHANRAPLFL